MLCLILDILIILLGIGFCCGFDISDFHDFCGKTITNPAGELDFDVQKLPAHLPGGTCSVTIQLPTTIFSSRTRALFYFTKFDLSKICKDGNVTILDGNPDKGIQIEGLPPFICGQDKTLVNPDSVFTTKGDILTVTFKRGVNVTAFHGKFNIKYVIFSTGACEAKGVHRCSNGRCIPKWYSCSTYIDACSESQTDCTFDKDVTTSSPKTNSTLGFFLYMLICSACLLLFSCCGILAKGECPSLQTFSHRARRRFHGVRESRRSSFAVDPWPIEDQHSPIADDDSNTRLYSGGTEADTNSNDSPNSRHSLNESGNDDSDIDIYNDISLRDVDVTSSNAHLPDTSVDSPPSYDDVRPPPSYDDVHPPPSYNTVAPPPSYDNAPVNRLQIQLYRR